MGFPGEGRNGGRAGPLREAPGHGGRHVQTTRQPPCSPLPLLPPPARPRSQDLLVAPGGHLPGPDTQTTVGLASASGSQAGISPEIDSSLRGFRDSRGFQAARFQAEASQLSHVSEAALWMSLSN